MFRAGLTLLLTDKAEGLNPTGVFIKLLKGTQEVTSQTSTQTVQFSLQTWPPPLLSVDERRASLIGRFSGSKVTAAEQGEADRKYAVTDRSRVSPRAGEEEEEELQVWQQEDRCPHPDRKCRQASTDALGPADGEGRS